MKTILKGIWYTIILWIAFLLLLCIAIIAVPFVFVLLPVGAFMYAKNPELIISDIKEETNG